MSATPEFVAEVATGFPAAPLPEYDRAVVVVGCTHAGTYEPRQWGASSDIAGEYTSGPACRDARHLVTRTGLGVLLQRVEATTPGSYGTLDDSAFTGTAEPVVVASVVPRDEGELYFRCITGGTIGDGEITYAASDDNGRLGADETLRLGTASRITFADVNAAIEFDPPVAALAAYVEDLRLMTLAHFVNIGNLDEVMDVANNLKLKYEAHRILTAGGVHGLADGTNAISSPNATDLASAIVLLNEMRTDYEAHRILTAGGVHGGADGTNAISAPVATDLETAVALARDLYDNFEAHRIEVGGAVHGAPDATNALTVPTVTDTHGASDLTSGAGIPGTPVTTLALARTCLIALVDAALLHVVLTAGSVHGAADTTAETALNAIDISGSSTGQEVLTAALAYGAAIFDGHTERIASSIHGIADARSMLTQPNPTRGTVNVGDIVRVNVTAPAWGNTQLAEALTALAESDHEPSMILLSGRIVPANMPTISTALDTIESNGKRCLLVAQARKRGNGETEAQWRAALVSEWAEALDYRVAVCAGDGLAAFTDGIKTRQYARGFSTQAMRRLMQIARYRTAWEYELGAIADFTTVDGNGITIGHDEKKSPGLKAAKFWVVYREKLSDGSRGTLLNFDMTRFSSVDRVRSVRVNRITNRLILEIRAVGLGLLGKTYDVKRTGPTSGILSQKAIDAIRPMFEAPIQNGFREDISDWRATDMIVIGQSVTIDPDTDAFDLVVTINYTPKLPVGRVSATFAVRLGT